MRRVTKQIPIKKHYASEAQKLKDKIKSSKTAGRSGKKNKKSSKKKMKKQFIYSFKLMDLNTRMYLAYGTSFQSEKTAFIKAVVMAESAGLTSIRLDRYYSAQMYVKLMKEKFGDDVMMYLIPKKNATVKGPWKWKQMLQRFVNDTHTYLREYFRRNQSESGISEDRIDTADFCTVLWHNLFWIR